MSEQITLEDNKESIWAKTEAVIFPVLAGIIGIGYSVAILVNNPITEVLTSPHALILLAVFISIAYFPLRAAYRSLTDRDDAGHD